MHKKVNISITRSVILCFLFSFLAACSTNKINQPTKLERVKDQVSIKRLWKRSVGTGDDGLALQLSPVRVQDELYTIDIEGNLSVLDRILGKKIWSRKLKEGVSGGLGDDKKHLYYTTFQGELVCIDRANGDEIWRVPLTSVSIAAPASNGQLVVAQTIDGKLLAFSAENGASRWRYDSAVPLLSLRGSPTPLISQKYTISNFANGEMVTIDNRNGSQIWKAVLGLPKGRTELERLVDADGQAVLDGDKLYAIAYQGKLVALDVSTGHEIWSKDMSSYNGVALGFSQIYVTTDSGLVIAFNQENGKEIWRNEKLKYRRLSTPVIFGNTLITDDFKGYLHFLSPKNGEFVARKRPDHHGIMGKSIVYGNDIYLYGRTGSLIAYHLDDSAQTSSENQHHQKTINPARSVGSRHK